MTLTPSKLARSTNPTKSPTQVARDSAVSCGTAESPLVAATNTLKSTDNNLRHADAQLRAFMATHCVAVGPQIMFRATLEGAQAVRDQYWRLCKIRDKARDRFQESLKDYAMVKSFMEGAK
jgi:hypothetical protein